MQPSLPRREFVRNTFLFSILAGLEPFEALAGKGVKPLEAIFDLLSDVAPELNSFQRQYNNYTAFISLTPKEQVTQYNGLIKILAETSNPKWSKYSEEKKIKTIVKAAPFKEKPARESDFQALAKAGYATAVASYYTYIVTTEVVAMAAAMSVVAPITIPTLLASGTALYTGGSAIYDAYRGFSDKMSFAAVQASQAIRSNVYERAAINGNFEFDSALPGLKLNLTKQNVTIPASQNLNNAGSGQDLTVWMAQNANNIFKSKEELAAFLDVYVDKIGDIQAQSLQKVLNAQKQIAKDNEEAARKIALVERDTAAFYQSINNLVGLAIDKFAAPKEAAILKTMLGAGFQYALTGMTPMGWASIGMNVASVLMSNGNDGSRAFNAAVMKALQQIQRQLNVIIEGINDINKNQIATIKQLYEIMSTIHDMDQDFKTLFANINTKIDLSYKRVKQADFERLKDNFAIINNRLVDAYRDKTDDFFIQIQNLRDLAEVLDNTEVTGYIPGSYSGQVIKESIDFDRKFSGSVSLYDSIGWVTALHSYDYRNNAGTSSAEVVHPVHFANLTDTIIGWMMLGSLTKSQKLFTAAKLKEKADAANKTLNACAEKSEVVRRCDHFAFVSNELLRAVHNTIQSAEDQRTSDHNALASQLRIGGGYMIDISNVRDPSIKDINNSSYFSDNHNDDPIFNLALELGILQSISTSDSKPTVLHERSASGSYREMPKEASLTQIFPNFKNGSVIGAKTNRLNFNSVLINARTGARASFTIGYTCQLLVSNFQDDLDYNRCGGHDCNYDYYYIRRVATATSANTIIHPNWQGSVRQTLVNAGYNVDETISGLMQMNLHTFINYLVNEWGVQQKRKYVESALRDMNGASFASFDGTGISLLGLSKLNNLVTSKEVRPYALEYFNEAYLRSDLEASLRMLAHTGYGTAKDLFSDLSAKYTDSVQLPYFYLKRPDGTNTLKLDPAKMSDFVVLVLNRTLHQTIQNCRLKATDVTSTAGEPYILQSLAKLHWYMDLVNA